MQTAPQRFFYGWVIVAAATAIIATGMGLMDALGVFMEPLETTFGWGRGQIGRASLVCWLVSGLSSLLCGALSDRIGTRVVVLCGGLVFGVGMLVLSRMQIETAHTVLDLGCGTGVVARTIARRPGFAGTVTGIDLSPYLADVATRLATEEGVDTRVTFRVGDTRRLDFPDAVFDAVVAHTLMNHVDDPVAVVKEAARVLKPGGRVGIFDSDFSTIAFNHPDPAQGKAYDDALINALVTNPRIMRQMPRVLRTAGLELVAAFPYVLADIGTADYWLASVESYRRLLPQGGTMTAAEADAWADALLQDSKAGGFFGACNFYSYVAKRP